MPDTPTTADSREADPREYVDTLLAEVSSRLSQNTPVPVPSAACDRLVSTLYDALFHEWSAVASSVLQVSDRERLRFRRVLEHTEMVNVCKSFDGTLPDALTSPQPAGAAEPVQKAAELFTRLQKARHVADYDRLAPAKSTADIEDLHRETQAVAANFRRTLDRPADDPERMSLMWFGACLFFGDRLRKRKGEQKSEKE